MCGPRSVFHSALFAAGLSLAAPLFAAGWDISIYVTDFGINQWSSRLVPGGSFEGLPDTLFPELPEASRIALPMPADEILGRLSHEELRTRLARTLSSRVGAGLAAGVDRFEVRLVQNVNSAGYFDAARQELARRYAAAAYEAIGQVHASLESRGSSTYVYAVTGSNGATLFTRTVNSWSSFVDGVDFIDGRADAAATLDAIRALGPHRVRFFNTRLDFPAPFSPLGEPSIGNYDVVAGIKERFPEVSSFLVTPVGINPLPGSNHLAVMSRPDSLFLVQENRGSGHALVAAPWLARGSDLRPEPNPFSAAGSPAGRQLPHDELVYNVSLFDKTLSLAESIAGQPLVSAPTATALSLMPAVLEDMRNHERGVFHPLTSHTLEQAGRLGLEHLPKLVAGLQASGRLPPSFQLPALHGVPDLVAGAASHLGKGRADVDVIAKYLEAASQSTAAIAGGMLGGTSGAAIAADLADLAIHKFRKDTQPLFAELVNAPVRKKMASMWLTAQESNLARGVPIQSLEEFYGAEELAAVGFKTSTVARLDSSLERADSTRGGAPLEGRELGGVDAAMTPRAERRDLGDLADEVRGARPAEDALGWPLPEAEEPNDRQREEKPPPAP